MEATHLRFDIEGWPVNEYQITDNRLELRILDSNGRPFPDQRSAWRRLTASELVLHLGLNTVVASWFVEKTVEWELPS